MATEKEVQDVIRTLIAEGVGEGTEGMRRIAETILNRAEQRGISPAEVVRQRAQYTGYSDPGPAAVRAFNDPAALTAAQAAWELAQGPDDPTGGANHYWNPNIVNPSWAGSMTQLGQFGNHAFATDRPVPPLNIPNVPPSPANLSPTSAAVRQMTSPTGGNSALQTALNQVATRERNRVTPQMPPVVSERTIARIPTASSLTAPGAVNASVGGLSQDSALSAALAQRSRFNGDPLTPSNGPVVARIPTPSAFNGDPLTPSAGSVVATIPTRAVPPMSRAPVSYAGQERIPTPPTSASANIASQRAEQMGLPRVQRPTIPDRLAPSPAGLPALYGTMTPTQVAQIGVPSLAPPQITPRRTLPAIPPPRAVQRVAPVPYSRPSFGMPVAAAPRAIAPPIARQPLNVVVTGARTAAPTPFMRPAPNPVQAARQAVLQSGDTSSGNRLEVAQQQAMAQSWREAQERKR